MLYVFCFASLNGNAQFERPDNAFSVGYQYSNFGNSLSAAHLQMEGMNQQATDDGSRFTNDRNAYGLVLRYTIKGDRGLVSEFALGNKKVVSSMSYQDTLTNSVLDIRTKQRMRYLSYGLHYSHGSWMIGTSLDLGVFSSLIRQKGGAIDDAWRPWFYTQKATGGGITGKTPVVGWTIAASYLFTPATELRIYRQFTAFGMGAQLSNSYFSMANWGIELAITFGS